MKLHVFETCPYCLRVRIFAGLKGLPLTIVPMTPGEVPEHLRKRVGRTTVPILELGDEVLQNSAEIICQLDAQGTQLLSGYQTSAAFEAWRASIRAPLDALCYPRMPGLSPAELASPGARCWVKSEMPKRIGMSFAEALAKTGQLTDEIAGLLPAALRWLDSPLRFDTIAALADLQSLTMVAELHWPNSVGSRFQTLMHRAGMAPFPPVDQTGYYLDE
ncbi:glutathione S-transferase N-terminal domain-containing protein [Leisingera sp. ANG-M1]|uniref:glutathione S-transferase N-terminal domain-containing protein n=1 Tax=Leisingera sp. ANG-M1 TaxID=1577895 RepID=UPI00057E39DC|nr:glutathione S-transferase N-terminal domain-containing protein [Leisingera sp. ANG-M1]